MNISAATSLKLDKLYFKEYSDFQRNVLERILKFECIIKKTKINKLNLT